MGAAFSWQAATKRGSDHYIGEAVMMDAVPGIADLR
jgi:hypothetical protein